ncbi:hypothetical protein VAWG006_17150 [Aeromonas enteropelogenes]|uniref:HEAT repeat domain-containing protein n=1 Tax=Aeromonas sp. 19NY04SH05-1 TaxID=2920537 RepID=A0AAU6TDR5_9GAMM|nr:hypothetical protein VAWG006_17150 [Aeromonas enteropelogenes]BEE21626.1 hypothetical protein VAWG007_17210 [Aeromonas enteropelogenes]
MSLEETRCTLLNERGNVENLLILINEIYRKQIKSEGIFLTEALSELHNTGEIDLLKIFEAVNDTSYKNNPYVIMRVVETTLPSLKAKVEDILPCLTKLTDLASGHIVYGAFECFCRVDNSRPKDSVDFILKQTELDSYAPFIYYAIMAYESGQIAERIQIVKALIANDNEVVRNQAYSVLGRQNITENWASSVWDIIKSSAINEHADSCRASIFRSIVHFGNIFPSYWPHIESLLASFVEGASLNILHAISNTIAFQQISIPDSIQKLLIKQLHTISPEQSHIISDIDYLLVNLIKKELYDTAIELLESILSYGVEITSLSYFSRELLGEYTNLRNHIITKWFLHGEKALCHNISILLHNIAEKDFELHADMTLLDNEEKKVFVSRKAIGWLFTRPVATASFIMSISRSAHQYTIETLEEILYDPLLLSYPSELKKLFQTYIDNNEQEYICKPLLDKLEAHNLDILKVSGLKELTAPSKNIDLYWNDFEKDMQKSYEEASKNSFFRLIATPKRLLYGNSSIYYVHQMDEQSSRQEMQMHSFSHSSELPTLNILDPESLDYSLRVFRCERMKNEINS